MRSYAGVRLIDGVGALCVIGHQPRRFSDSEIMKLRILGKYVDIQLLAHGAFTNVECVAPDPPGGLNYGRTRGY